MADDSKSLSISVRFLGVGHELLTRRGAEPFATYEVCSSEAGKTFHSVVRWSDLCRLHDELPSLVTRLAMPPFRRHTLRSKAARTSVSFCTQRAATMEAVLCALANTTGTSFEHNSGPEALRSFLASGGDVEGPTPEGRWYAVTHGWPEPMFENTPTQCLPRELSRSAAEEPALQPPLCEVIGEMRVEVLKASGLVQADRFSQNDVYALFVLGGIAVQTATLEDMAHPRRITDHSPLNANYSMLTACLTVYCLLPTKCSLPHVHCHMLTAHCAL